MIGIYRHFFLNFIKNCTKKITTVKWILEISEIGFDTTELRLNQTNKNTFLLKERKKEMSHGT